MPVFLTIAIPTWNRSASLKNNLASLVQQIQRYQLSDKVEILVSDNASIDDTSIYCASMSADFSFIKYHRQSQNHGANANFQYVIEAANGEYVWLLGDDDLLADDVMPRVIDDITLYEPDVIIGASIFDITKEKATHHGYRNITVTNREVLSKNDVIALAGKMSGLIFNKSSVLPVISALKPVISASRTPWPHLAWFMVLLNDPERKLLILPYGINQLVAGNWFNLLFDGKALLQILFVEYRHLLIALQPYLDPDLHRQLINRSVSTRKAPLLKCVLYGTYLNGYWEFLVMAAKELRNMAGIKNKLYGFVFLVCPLLIPVTLRKLVCQIARLRWEKLRVTIGRIHKAKIMLMLETSAGCRQYNDDQL